MGIGTDTGGAPSRRFGHYCDELRDYAAAGIPASEILRMATSGNAALLGMGNQVGSIRPGMKADLIACEGDPLVDVGCLESIDVVIKGGKAWVIKE